MRLQRGAKVGQSGVVRPRGVEDGGRPPGQSFLDDREVGPELACQDAWPA
jgi:hypothetical protein